MGDWAWFKLAIAAILEQGHPQADSALKDFLGNLESLVKIVAVIAGGIWTYQAFIRSRGYRPRATLTHQISHRALDDQNRLLIVDVFLENAGEISIRLKKAETWVQQLVPLPPSVRASAAGAKGLAQPDGNEAAWPLLDRIHSQDLDHKKYVINPKECDQFRHNFAISVEVKTVQVYTYLEPIDGGIGWKLKTTYDMDASPVAVVDSKPELSLEAKVSTVTNKAPSEKKHPSEQQPPDPPPPTLID